MNIFKQISSIDVRQRGKLVGPGIPIALSCVLFWREQSLILGLFPLSSLFFRRLGKKSSFWKKSSPFWENCPLFYWKIGQKHFFIKKKLKTFFCSTVQKYGKIEKKWKHFLKFSHWTLCPLLTCGKSGNATSQRKYVGENLERVQIKYLPLPSNFQNFQVYPSPGPKQFSEHCLQYLK